MPQRDCGGRRSGWHQGHVRRSRSEGEVARGMVAGVETELIVHALEPRMPDREVPIVRGARSAGSTHKLYTLRDGQREAKHLAYLRTPFWPQQP